MITAEQHSTTIAKKIIGRFDEDIPVRAGFSEFFPMETTGTLMVDVEVSRDNDLIAVDVKRFTEGNKSKFSRSTQHTYVPPFFKEDYDFARDEVYMNTVALGVTTATSANQAIAQNALKNLRKNRQKIERAIRKQQTDALQTGIISIKNGDSIDFRRKAESIVALGAGNRWNEAGSNPITDLTKGMRFLRDVGNSTGGTVNLIMRSEGLNAFLSNESMKTTLESRRMDRANIDMPQFNETTGLTFHGQVAAGDFNLNLWTYNEKYTAEDGTTKYYLDENKAILLPSDFKGKTVFGGLPTLRRTSVNGVVTEMPGIVESMYLVRGYSDQKTLSSTLELTSAPLVVPFTIDKIYTLQVLA